MVYRALFALALLMLMIQPIQAATIINTPTIVTPEDVDESKLSLRQDSYRKATVRVETPFGHGSGALFKHSRHIIVITAAHVIDNWPIVKIISEAGTVGAYPVYVDTVSDIAVLVVPKTDVTNDLKDIAIRYRAPDTVVGVGTKLFYGSYPGHHSKLVFDGQVSGYDYDPTDFHIIVHGYVWPGSSGSAVFDKRGRIVGVITAIQTGRLHGYPPQAIPSIIWVKPISLLDKDILKEALKDI